MPETQGDARGFPPAPVRRAAYAWWGATACWFLGSVVSRLLGSAVAAVGDGTGLSFDRVPNGSAPLPVAVALLVFLVAAGLWALLVHGVYRGASWARLLLAVVGVLGVLDVVLLLVTIATGPLGPGEVLHGLFFVAVLGLSFAGFSLMFRAEARPYFSRH